MYTLYTKEYEVTNSPVASVEKGVYHKIFCEKYNLSFLSPKKDQCSKCTKYQMLKGRDKEDFTEKYQAHLKRKKEARSVKIADKARCSADNNFMSATFEMQSVLQIPSSPASLMYYSR